MRKMVKVFQLLPPAICCAYMILDLVRCYPSNHGGGYFEEVVISAIFWMIAFAVGQYLKALSKLSVVFVSVLVFISIVCDIFNLNVHYETWIKRGMPDWGQFVIGSK